MKAAMWSRLFRYETGWLCVFTLLSAWPMWAVEWPPGLDWCEHVAIIDILTRLWHGDAALAAHHRIAIQPVGYHLLYGLAVPLASVSSAATALRLLMTLSLFAHVGLLAHALRRLPAPPLLALVGVPAFYSTHFVWGFVATLLATPFALAAVIGLVADGPPWALSARGPFITGVCACLACVAHIVFLPFLLIASAFAYVTSYPLRKRLAIGASIGALLPAIPAIVARGLDIYRASATDKVTIERASVLWGFRKLWNTACSFDHRDAMVGWLLLWAMLLTLMATALHSALPAYRNKGEARLLPLLFATPFVLQYVIPLETGGPLGSSYLLNIRAMCLVPIFAAWLSARSPLWKHPQVRIAARTILICSCVLTLVGATRLGQRYNVEVAEWLDKAAVLPSQARLGVHVEAVHVHREWPPLRQSLAATAFPSKLSLCNGIFLNGHLPVHDRTPGFFSAFNAEVMELSGLLRAKEDHPERTAELWKKMDGLFYQKENFELSDPNEVVPPERANVLAIGRSWVLWGPPKP